MKKVFCVLICILMIFSFSACSEDGDNVVSDALELKQFSFPEKALKKYSFGMKEDAFLKKEGELDSTEREGIKTYLRAEEDDNFEYSYTYHFMDEKLMNIGVFAKFKILGDQFTQEEVYANFTESVDTIVRIIEEEYATGDLEGLRHSTNNPGISCSWECGENTYIQLVGAVSDIEKSFGSISINYLRVPE